MQTKIKYIFITIFSILLQITALAKPVFDLNISETKINGPVSAVITHRNNLITYNGSKWRIDDTRVLIKTNFAMNGQIKEEWDYNNYEEANGKLEWNYNEKGMLDYRAYLINDKPVSVVRFFYTADGKIDEEIRFDSKGATIGKLKYQYDADGKLTLIIERDSAGATTKQIKYSYTKSGTKSLEETLWYGDNEARLVRQYDANEHIKEATGYKAEKVVYHCYYRTNSSGVIIAMLRNFEGELTRYDISYNTDLYGNWTRKTVIIFITRNGFTVPGESYMDTRSLNYLTFTAFPTG